MIDPNLNLINRISIKEEEEDRRPNDEADLFDSDEETTRIFLQ